MRDRPRSDSTRTETRWCESSLGCWGSTIDPTAKHGRHLYAVRLYHSDCTRDNDHEAKGESPECPGGGAGKRARFFSAKTEMLGDYDHSRFETKEESHASGGATA